MTRVTAVALVMSAGVLAEHDVRFVDITRQAGIAFRHVNGASADKHLVETMGSGGLFFDYDNDGWVDIFLVDGGSLADPAVARAARHRLYRNRGNGTFEDATARSEIRHRDYGMGTCAGDVDGDGSIDLYITNFGSNALYRNRGDGSFADITATSGTGGAPSWSAGCAFADLDRDGDLDLFVARYVDADAKRSPFCGSAAKRTRFYCHPLNFNPLPPAVYRNNGKGVFTDVSAASQVAAHRSNGLGVVIADHDDDGWPDVFVANDSMPNSLFRNLGDGRFAEIGLGAGVAVASDGKARAGMGIDAADYDGDGRVDLVITNLDFETHSVYRSLAAGLFASATSESGIGGATLPFVGFGTAFFDADSDGRLDVAIVNGHIMDNASEFRAGAVHAQRKLLFRGVAPRRFGEIGRTAGPGFAGEKVGRGLATGDIDNDGDLDLLVTNNGQTADLIRNESAHVPGAVVLRLLTADGRRDAIGATVQVSAGGATLVRTVKAGSSYLSQNDLRVHVGLGAAKTVDRVDVRWPTGRREAIRGVRTGHLTTIREGMGLVASTPLVR